MKSTFSRGLLATLPVFALSTLATSVQASEFESSGKVAVEHRQFFDKGMYPGQLEDGQTSFMVEPEMYWSWGDGQSSLTFKPFYRKDLEDGERTHFDIRELAYVYAADDWELRVGVRKEFWGVTEFQHLVDVVNQTDSVESFDGEEKLGQPMVNLSLVKDWGIVDLYLLTGFRERTFAGEDGRFRAPLVVNTDDVLYESSAKESHLDLAVRWSHTIGDADIGAYIFQGTNRDPILTPGGFENGQPTEFTQYYNQMTQFGFDGQLIVDDWLWKFEAIYRDTDKEDYWASQAGFEYTYVGIMDSDADLGWLVEYGWDSRGSGTLTEPGGTFQNDLFAGARLAFNDVQSTEVLMGFGTDLDHSSTSFLIEASRRIGESFVATLDVRLFDGDKPIDPISAIEKDDQLQFSLEWYF